MTDQSGEFHQDIYYTARDGLRLYGRKYPAATYDGRKRCPVLCLAGLTRNSKDFHSLARAISSHETANRDVYALDYRGRGHSAFDPNWRNYALQIELLDILDFFTLNDIHQAVVVGTSRGGLLAMLLGAAQPTLLRGAILNDIGPVIDTAGLARIAGYVGRTPTPHTWQQAADLVKRHNKAHFPKVSDEQWMAVAKQWFNDKDGKPAAGYDHKLGQALAALKGKIPELWGQFETLKHVPLLILRGANSDILSEETVEAMLRRHPKAAAHTVSEEGHAPLLQDAPTQTVIADFLAEIDQV